MIKEVLGRAAGGELVTEFQDLINIGTGHHFTKPGAGKLKEYFPLKMVNTSCGCQSDYFPWHETFPLLYRG